MIDIITHRTGIILAGGKSTRMGTDKGILKYKNKAFIQYSIEALQNIVDEIIIVSNDVKHDIFNLKRFPDLIKNSGPLAGIYTGLYYSKTENNIIITCDVPQINQSILELLIDTKNESFDVIQLRSEQKNMPLIAHYKKRNNSHFLKALGNGERRMNSVLKNLNVKTITVSKTDEKYLKNINTPKEFTHELEH